MDLQRRNRRDFFLPGLREERRIITLSMSFPMADVSEEIFAAIFAAIIKEDARQILWRACARGCIECRRIFDKSKTRPSRPATNNKDARARRFCKVTKRVPGAGTPATRGFNYPAIVPSRARRRGTREGIYLYPGERPCTFFARQLPEAAENPGSGYENRTYLPAYLPVPSKPCTR